tara:strand:+ start:60 stop:1118 length:1059 start_codon:yes stop_codon:yes gene_type:complete
MAIASSDRIALNYFNLITTGTVSSTALTANGKVGFIFQAPKTGTIDRILWQSGTASGSPTVDVRLETVSTGSPSGTLFGTNTNVVTGTVASNTAYESTLTAGASVTQGDFLALVWAYASGTSIQIALASATPSAGGVMGSQLNLPQISTAGTYSLISGRIAYAAIRYSDGAYCPIAAGGVAYGVGSTTNAYTSGEKGIRFRLPYTARVAGFWTTYDPDVDHTVNLYADATAPGGTAILSQAVATNRFIQKNAVASVFSFASKTTLAANTWYRLVASSSGSPGIRYGINTIPSASYAAAVATDHHQTESSGGSWSDTTTILPQMGVIIDGLDDGAGGGGGGFRLVNIRGGADQ